MSADGLACRMGCGHFIKHLFIAHEHTGEVHHFTEADDAFPLHGFGHFFRPNGGTRCLEPRRGRYTRGHLHPHVNGLLLRFVHHQLHAFEAKDICDLMRVNEHSGCAAHRHRAHKLCDCDHA